jgi:hypothetical protein
MDTLVAMNITSEQQDKTQTLHLVSSLATKGVGLLLGMSTARQSNISLAMQKMQ